MMPHGKVRTRNTSGKKIAGYMAKKERGNAIWVPWQEGFAIHCGGLLTPSGRTGVRPKRGAFCRTGSFASAARLAKQKRPPEGDLLDLARPAGIEPATPGLEGRCSIRLSYGRSTLH